MVNVTDFTLPSLARSVRQIPSALREVAAHLNVSETNPVVVLPYEGVGMEPYQEFVLDFYAGTLLIGYVNSKNSGITRISPDECLGIQYSNCLLYTEIRFLRPNDTPVILKFNTAGESVVAHVLRPFLEAHLPGAEVSKYLHLPPQQTAFAIGNMQLFAPGELVASVHQPMDREHVTGPWIRRKRIIPAAAMAVSNRQLVIEIDIPGGFGGLRGKFVSFFPLRNVRSVIADQCFNDVLSIGVHYGPDQVLHVPFSTVGFPELRNAVIRFISDCTEQLENVIPILSPQQELLRLTGVSLADAEAQNALKEIHEFKWLEAERVGFDTWAAIQPHDPLRAAAVHWVRKYFSQFENAHRPGPVTHGLAS